MRELTLKPTRYAEDAGKQMVIAETISVYSKYVRYVVRMNFGYVTPAGSARQVFQGELVPGPWAFGFPLSTVIDNYGGTAREAENNRIIGMEFDAEIGDKFIIDDRVYVLTDDERYDYPKLKLVH
jgi:hypothetical protein